MERNFGMPEPEGYRKALRLMKQAEKFKRPIITFIDTPGAYPGVGAEERGQGEAIAKNIMEMSKLKVPIICIVIGEGSSGGALAIGVGDKIVMLENAVYSILSPEGFASILYKDASKAKEAAENMKITAEDLKKLEIIEKIIEEPEEGVTEKTLEKVCTELKKYLKQTILELQKENIEKLLEKRYEKFRKNQKVQEIRKPQKIRQTEKSPGNRKTPGREIHRRKSVRFLTSNGHWKRFPTSWTTLSNIRPTAEISEFPSVNTNCLYAWISPIPASA